MPTFHRFHPSSWLLTALSVAIVGCGAESTDELDSPWFDPLDICETCDPTGGPGTTSSTSSSTSSSSTGGGSSPDLVLEKTSGSHCARNAWGELVVKVKNAGASTAGASKTRVSWSSGGSQDFSTGSIAPGSVRKIYVNMPMACFGGDGYGNCTLSLQADALGQIAEASEANNTASNVVCPGG